VREEILNRYFGPLDDADAIKRDLAVPVNLANVQLTLTDEARNPVTDFGGGSPERWVRN
jgi:hypothetical protein